MGENERSHLRHLFTVQLRQEEPDTDQAELRGQAQYTGDGETRAFREWPELLAFIVAKLQESKIEKESA